MKQDGLFFHSVLQRWSNQLCLVKCNRSNIYSKRIQIYIGGGGISKWCMKLGKLLYSFISVCSSMKVVIILGVPKETNKAKT